MSTIVCQNHVSCFESQLTESTTTLKLKVAAPPPTAGLDLCRKLGTDDHAPANLEFGNWGFFQTISRGSSGDKKESIYTHPLAKNSSFSRLSPKSLELCTENLGSETGTDIITDGSSIFSSNSSENSKKTISPKNPHHKEANSRGKAKSFPPPLTTMSGSSSLQVRRHREGGRLIIEALETPFRNSYLQAERSDGRLRMCFLTGCDAEETTTSAGGEQEDEEEEEEEEEEAEEENGDECGGEMAAAQEKEEEIQEAPGSELESEKEEFDGEINLEMGTEKFQRPSRCKEGGHGSKEFCSNWKPPLWVATS